MAHHTLEEIQDAKRKLAMMLRCVANIANLYRLSMLEAEIEKAVTVAENGMPEVVEAELLGLLEKGEIDG